MKKPALAIAFSQPTVALSAQTQKWDSSFRPNKYSLRVGQFKSYPNSAADVIFPGNSITANVDWSELPGTTNVRNRGLSGGIGFDVLERLAELAEGAPAKVFILTGINAISRNVPDSVILRNYGLIISRIKKASPKTKIYFQTLLPATTGSPNSKIIATRTGTFCT